MLSISWQIVPWSVASVAKQSPVNQEIASAEEHRLAMTGMIQGYLQTRG
jgi:hypothetical protein